MFDTNDCSNKIYFPFPCSYIKTKKVLHICRKIRFEQINGAPQGFWGSGENGYLFSGI